MDILEYRDWNNILSKVLDFDMYDQLEMCELGIKYLRERSQYVQQFIMKTVLLSDLLIELLIELMFPKV